MRGLARPQEVEFTFLAKRGKKAEKGSGEINKGWPSMHRCVGRGDWSGVQPSPILGAYWWVPKKDCPLQLGRENCCCAPLGGYTWANTIAVPRRERHQVEHTPEGLSGEPMRDSFKNHLWSLGSNQREGIYRVNSDRVSVQLEYQPPHRNNTPRHAPPQLTMESCQAARTNANLKGMDNERFLCN